ncbi:MAG TPA: HNH endonuclease, partial [Ktedonobacterales bacterium]|nr:HNH endonuclease [Ktedonobacterales bacterium]
IRQSYKTYQGTPAQIHNRSERNSARRKVEHKLGRAAVKGKDVDHKKHLAHGGSNAMSNLRPRTVHANRGDTR